MPCESPVTVVNVGYRSTNYWVVGSGTSRVLVDIGWPGTMGRMTANLRRTGVPLEEIRFALATHYHIDHAGLAQEFKNAGVPLLVMDLQTEFIPRMKRWTKPADNYLEITAEANIVIACPESRGLLEGLGIAGEILHTPGHSDDSVTLLLDDGSAFTGDLPPEEFTGREWGQTAAASWDLLRSRGTSRIYPAHGPIRTLGAGSPAPPG